jgi:hypothetical protein
VQLERIARDEVAVVRSDDGCPHLESLRREDVALLTICIVNQRDPRGAVGIVLDGSHAAGNTDFVTLEVDDTVAALVTATTATDGDATAVVAAGLLGTAVKLALFWATACHLREVRAAHEPPRRGCRIVFTYSHDLPLYCS